MGTLVRGEAPHADDDTSVTEDVVTAADAASRDCPTHQGEAPHAADAVTVDESDPDNIPEEFMACGWVTARSDHLRRHSPQSQKCNGWQNLHT